MTPPEAPDRGPTLDGLLALAAALVGVGIGAARLADNSFLTHLATGRLMLDEGIVRKDAFTWTSAGEPVVVQSWLASLLYGVVDDLAGFGGIRLLMAATAGVLGWLVWRISDRSPSLTTRLLVVAPVFFIGISAWSERPLLLALVGLTFVLWWVEDERDPRGLAVVGLLWVNVHGSWPLALVVLGARWVGSLVDRDAVRPAADEFRAGVWLGAGLFLGGIANPYGPRLLWFPIELLGRQETLAYVAEWKASSFEAAWTRLFIVLVVAAVFAARRAPYRLVVPAVVFLAAALLSARNIAPASLVLVPLLAAGLPALPGPDPERRSPPIRLGAAALAVFVVLGPVIAVRSPHVELDRYPVAAVDALEALGRTPGPAHVVHQDFVGNYLDLRYGPSGAAWIDDRFELHELALVEDYVTLLDGEPGWDEVLDRWEPDAVLWPSGRALVELATDAGWTVGWSDDDWVVLCPPDDPCS